LLDEEVFVPSLVKGIQLHCRTQDHVHETATGWLAPPSRSTTML
jgi:hypothetical protein